MRKNKKGKIPSRSFGEGESHHAAGEPQVFSGPIFTRILPLLVLLAVAFQLGRTYRFAETDLWWNLATGREIFAEHRIPTHDVFSFSPTLPTWHNHEWLTQIVFFKVFMIWGPEGIVIFKTGLAVLTIALSAAGALALGAGAWTTSFFIMLTAVGYYPSTSIRPQMFSYLFFAWFLFLWNRFPARSRWLWGLSLASMPLWVGFHGGFIVGLAILAVWSAGQVIDRGWDEGKTYVFLVGACVAMACINPYGLNNWKFLVEGMRHDRSMFPEWNPVTFRWQSQWPYFLTLILTAGALAASRLKRAWAEGAILLFTAFLGFERSRLTAFFVIAAWVFVPRHYESMLSAWSGNIQPSLKKLGTGLSFAAVLYGLTCVFYSIDPTAFQWDWRLKVAARTDSWHVSFPVDAIQYMKMARLSGNVACPLAWGGFLLWEIPDRVKVSLDGRWDTVYPIGFIQENVDFQNGIHWEEFLEKYKPDMVLAFKGLTVDKGLSAKPGGWARVFEGVEGVLFIKR